MKEKVPPVKIGMTKDVPHRMGTLKHKIGSELEFVCGGQKVKIANLKNKIEFEGESYTTSGFCKKFMPTEKRTPTNAYQGPKYFTFKGELLTDLRAKLGK